MDNYGAKKAAERMGFLAEGVLRKHMVWREANRDTALYSLTNSDWRDGAKEQIEALLAKRSEGVLGLKKTKGEKEEGGEGETGGGGRRSNLMAELEREKEKVVAQAIAAAGVAADEADKKGK